MNRGLLYFSLLFLVVRKKKSKRKKKVPSILLIARQFSTFLTSIRPLNTFTCATELRPNILPIVDGDPIKCFTSLPVGSYDHSAGSSVVPAKLPAPKVPRKSGHAELSAAFKRKNSRNSSSSNFAKKSFVKPLIVFSLFLFY